MELVETDRATIAGAFTLERPSQVLGAGESEPLRLRVERQLGYKHAKYVNRIEAVERFDTIHGGRGGFWEDFDGYEWYAGI